jgi:lipopolysaccharide transport system ATP-binding protein
MSANAIEFTNVWKKFKKGEKFNSIRDAVPNLFRKRANSNGLKEQEFWAVKDVTFQIKKGGVLGIMGPNGAGKSTILKLLSRIMNPNKGEMKINGRLSALIEVTAGFHPELTGRENVYLNGTILGMRKKEIDEKFDQIVEFSGVREFIDTPVKRYSSGMFSRLGFSVAAHMDPDILLVDEVLSVGDIAFQSKCAEKIRELLKSGATVVLVSHQLNMIQSLCKRVLLLQNGEVIRDGQTDEVIPQYQNLVFKNNEEEIKEKIRFIERRVKVDTRQLLDIMALKVLDEKGMKKEQFWNGDSVAMTIEYEANEPIDSPIFTLEIVRADGVVCIYSRSDLTGLKVGTVKGKGKVGVDLGSVYLAPGIYMVKVAAFDKQMIHPYVVHSKNVFRVEMTGRFSQTEAVLLPDIKWKIS